MNFIGMPRGRKRASLRLSVADYAGHDQIRIVERCAIGVDKRIALARHPHGSSLAFQAPRGSEYRPGNENCRNSRFMPAASSPMSG